MLDWVNRIVFNESSPLESQGYENQFGFQSNLSTEFAVSKLLNYIIETLEKSEIGVCIFLDFAKAFDTVNHEILIQKLEYYGIRGVAMVFLRYHKVFL